jgi:hypothetical protein
MFRIAIHKLFGQLFAGVPSSHCGGLGSIPGMDMTVSDALVEDPR